ncbi:MULTISPECIES: flagellar motor protein MotA [Agrobacterium]|uniref:Flagellar motor protein MotA n=2 Tax=Agrobacterium TaxID=357 RepID=A0A9X3KSA7_9HYPH|nr:MULTISPECIES: flagellar motor protein MotA [Agrobacterium]MBA4774511.1 flagellar motor protein MotA [Hyphomicrobiales bacterium]MCZ7853427.1 flagellar motor protein MotA [Agrobacterium salinitolerans]MCZ7858633.1 flagellar motor protein MotA [Agrobacterium salinitolerans]MCZ7862127.1 flagellar motor protein MotA [Agrobacterium salinitolerans]MCZ7893209.1 flagellar motor protein MotA [Agrobacterium salinitolerans]
MADSELLDLGVEKPVTTRQYSHKLSSPTPFLWTMVLFLILVGFLAAILYRQAHTAFMSNPGLNGFILGVLAIGIILVFTQTMSLRSEVSWFNAFRAAGSVDKVGRAPKLLAPMSTLIGKRGEVRLSAVTQRTILDSIATRLDETRDTSRYLVGLLVFLGLLGTFWGLIGTIGAISNVIQSLDPSAGDSNDILGSLKAGLTAPLSGMGTAFSSSLLGLSGSLILGFLDLQAGRAQNRFYTQLENWLSSVTDTTEGPREFKGEPGAVVSTERSLAAMTSLAEGIQGLVKNMRSEQQMLRDWIEAQQEESKSLRRTLDRLSERIDSDTKSSGRIRHDNGSE